MNETISDYNKQMSVLTNQASELKKQNTKIKVTIDSLNNVNQSMYQELTLTNAQNQKLQNKINNCQLELYEINKNRPIFIDETPKYTLKDTNIIGVVEPKMTFVCPAEDVSGQPNVCSKKVLTKKYFKSNGINYLFASVGFEYNGCRQCGGANAFIYFRFDNDKTQWLLVDFLEISSGNGTSTNISSFGHSLQFEKVTAFDKDLIVFEFIGTIGGAGFNTNYTTFLSIYKEKIKIIADYTSLESDTGEGDIKHDFVYLTDTNNYGRIKIKALKYVNGVKKGEVWVPLNY